MPTPAPKTGGETDSVDEGWDAPGGRSAPSAEAASDAQVTARPPSRKKTEPSLDAPAATAGDAEGSDPPSELRIRDAMAVKTQAETSLSGLHQAVEQALADSRLASRTLARELERTRDVVAMARRERDEALSELEAARADHARVLEEHDVFVANLIEDYETRLARLRGSDRAPIPTPAPDTEVVEDGDRPTVPLSVDHAQAAVGPSALDRVLREKRALEVELEAKERRLAKTAQERERSVEMLRKLVKQRDDAQEALGRAVAARDEARSHAIELRARVVELQERIDRDAPPGSVKHLTSTQPAPWSARAEVVSSSTKGRAYRTADKDTAPDLSLDRLDEPEPLRTAQPAPGRERPEDNRQTAPQVPSRIRGEPTPPPELEAALTRPESEERSAPASPGSYSVGESEVEPEHVGSSRPPARIKSP